MSLKSILIHLAADDDHTGRLRVGYDLAKRHGARLTALYVIDRIGMPHAVEGRAASVGYIAEATAAARETAEAVRAEFDAWCAENAVPGRWMVEEGEHLALLARHSHVADLAIVSQTEPSNLEDMIFNALPDHLAMVGSCPTLVLPHGYGGAGTPGRRVLVAWRDDRQCARAVRDGLPFLTTAERVVVALADAGAAHRASGARVIEWLALHGVAADLDVVARQGRTVAATLLAAAASHGCDMMVMGGYGHSRLRELVLGGTTHDILSGAELPVLMSH